MNQMIRDNLLSVHNRIIDAAQQFGRNPDEILLLAVSKRKPVSAILAAYEAGLNHFGENYLQEALEKILQCTNHDIQWHYIGAIQSNKTRDIAQHFHWVHTVASLKIARRLSEQRPEHMPALNICIQVNISGEASKAGIGLDEVDELVAAILPLPNIQLRGLMAIPAPNHDLASQREPYAQLKHCLIQCQQQYPEAKFDTLSIGMSNDLEAAIAEGATIVRIGTAIFGARD